MSKNEQKGVPLWHRWFIFIFLFFLIVIFAVVDALFPGRNTFCTVENFYTIGRQTAMVSLVAFGMTFVITAAQIDLSVGAIIGLVGMTSSMALTRWGLDVYSASTIGILTGVLIGLVNGILTAKLRIPSFLVTLGMLGIVRGISLTITGTQSVVVFNESFRSLWGAGDLAGIPVSVLWVLFFGVVSIILYSKTKFGNHLKAVGGNVVAAKYSGINADGVIIRTLMISGFLSAIAGLLMTARLGAGKPEVGVGMELDAIAAVILGGTCLFGGRGSMINTLVGAMIMGVISNGLIIVARALPAELQSSSSNIQMIIKGIVIIAAVSLSRKP